MPSKRSIRGPYPPGVTQTGLQSYYVDDADSNARMVTLHFNAALLVRAECSCTKLASLQTPCSHIRQVLAFRESVSPNHDSVASATSTSASRRRSASKTTPGVIADEPFVEPETLSSFTAIASSVLRAVQEEITAIQNSTNVRRILLTNGILTGSIAGNPKYKFDLDDDFHSPPDTPIELYVDEDALPVPGTIVSCEPDRSVELALDSFIGNIVPQATLESRLDFIWQRAAKRLEAYKETNFTGLIDSVLSPSPLPLYDSLLHEDWGDASPDPEQRNALQMSLCQRVTFVYGPPGTGKSMAIGWLVKELVHRGERVMIASHTNIAVDNALVKALDNPKVQTLKDECAIIRLGEPQNDKLEDLRIQKVVEKKTAGLNRELAALRERRSQVALAMNTAEEEVRIIEEHRSILAQHSTLEQLVKSLKDRIRKLEHEKQKTNEHLLKLQEQTRINSLSNLVLWLPRTVQKRETEARLQQIRTNLDQAKKGKEKAIERLEETTGKLKSASLPIEPVEFDNRFAAATSEMENRREQVTKLDCEINEIEEKIDAVAKDVLANVQIIGATLSKICIESALEKFNCDTLIIDELSTAPFPFVLVALGLPKKRVVLFGDPMQLPPISVSNHAAAKFWLQHDTYEIVKHESIHCILTKQRRMPPSIPKLVNERMYRENPLVTPPEFENKHKEEWDQAPFEGAQVIFVDTSSINPWSASDPNHSRYNLYSAEIVIGIIAQEIRRAINKVTEKPVVGVICPYRAQKKLIRRLCESAFPQKVSETEYKFEKYLDFHTVDAFQGEERDYIILDLTAGPPDRPGIRLSEDLERSVDTPRKVSKVSRLLNVAITRTRKKLIIVANRDYFERKLAQHEFVLELIVRAHSREQGYRSIDGEDYLRNELTLPDGFSRFLDETSFYACLQRDFEHCRSSVVIVSPFITRARVETLHSSILAMRGRNIKITVITRPLKELDYGLDAIKLLEKWGCVVKQRSRTHEKVVFIDNQIAYYGSLNTLSHRDTRETMHRIQGDAVVDLLYQFLDVLRSDAKPPKHSGSSSTWLNREECRSKLKNVRKIIGTQRHIPFQAILFNNTIEYLLDYPAVSEEDLMASFRDCGEKQLQHLAPFLDEILSILQRYRP